MPKKKKKTPPAPSRAAKAQQSESQSVLRLLMPPSQGKNGNSSPKLANFGRALWRGGARFSRTFLSMAGLVLLKSTRASLNLARKTPEWLRVNWSRRAALLNAPPSASSSSSSSSSSSLSTPPPPPPKDTWGSEDSGLMLQQFRAVEELQRTAKQLVEQRVKNSNIRFDHHVQRTEGAVSISIRSSSSIQIESSGERSAASSREVEKGDHRPFTRTEFAGEQSVATPREVEKANDSAPIMIESGSEPGFAMPRVDDKSNNSSSRQIESRGERSTESAQDGTSKEQVLAHMDLVMQRLPLPAMATVTDKRSKDHDKHRKFLRADVLRKYGAESYSGKVWCCIRREWMEPYEVRTAHLCPVSVGEAYLQYVFGDKGTHLWNAENAIPISCELEEALDAGQLVIVPAEAEEPEPDNLFLWDSPNESIPQANRFKIVVFDDSVRTKDGKFRARDLHGRMLGFQDPNFRPGMRYICFNVVTTLARRKRYKVRGSRNDLARLGDSRFMLSPAKFVRDSWLLKMCAQLGLDINGDAPRSNSTPDTALEIDNENDESDSETDFDLNLDDENDTYYSKTDDFADPSLMDHFHQYDSRNGGYSGRVHRRRRVGRIRGPYTDLTPV